MNKMEALQELVRCLQLKNNGGHTGASIKNLAETAGLKYDESDIVSLHDAARAELKKAVGKPSTAPEPSKPKPLDQK